MRLAPSDIPFLLGLVLIGLGVVSGTRALLLTGVALSVVTLLITAVAMGRRRRRLKQRADQSRG